MSNISQDVILYCIRVDPQIDSVIYLDIILMTLLQYF